MAFGHHEPIVENAANGRDFFRQTKLGAAVATPGSRIKAFPYFVVSPPSVTLIPLRKLKGNAGNPGAGS